MASAAVILLSEGFRVFARGCFYHVKKPKFRDYLPVLPSGSRGNPGDSFDYIEILKMGRMLFTVIIYYCYCD
jgi:hypothetical protein